MDGVLVRIGVDHSYGGWNAPVDPDSGRFVYVPIPETAKEFHPDGERLYDEVTTPLERFLRDHDASDVEYPIRAMAGCAMHLDPDFEHLTYGDVGNRRGSHIRALRAGDLLVFYAGLRSIRPGDRGLMYAIVGVYRVDSVVRAHEVEPSRRLENAHTRKRQPGESDIVVRASASDSGRCSTCVPIGEYRDRAYRVRHELLDAWGGLTVKGGYLQRSARPPRFLDARRFYQWWQTQHVPLLRTNFAG